MLQEDEVKKLIDSVLAKSKDVYQVSYGTGGVTYEYKGVPDYYPKYRESVKQMRRIAPHADVDVFPEMLFKHRAPNQSEEEAEYLRNTYRCTTHPIFVDYVNSVSQGLNEGNWSWEFAEGEDDKIEYLTEGVPVHGSIEVFVRSMLPALKAKDANGVIAVKPRSFKYTTNAEGELVVDDRELNEPLPFYYSSAQVVGWKEGVYAVIEQHTKSPVKYGGKIYNVGRVFEVYDDTQIWRVKQVGDYVDHTYEYEVYFTHDKGEVPVNRLMGWPSVEDNGEVYWTSPFYYAIDLLDRALAKDNNVEVSTSRIVFPTAIILADECDFSNDEGSCQRGQWLVDGDVTGTCPSCSGSGYKMNLSPFKNYYRKEKTDLEGGGDITPIEFVSPDTAGLEFVQNSAEKDKAEARYMMHLRQSPTNVQGGERETATVAGIDQKQHYKFVKPINDQTFDLFEWMVEQMIWQRYRSDVVPSFERPKSFDFRTTNDYLEDIKNAREAGLPDQVVSMLVYKFLGSLHFGNSETAKAITLMSKADRLLAVDSNDLAVKIAQQIVEPWEVVLHDSATHIVTSLILEEPSILDLDLDEQIKRVEEKAKTLVRETDTSTQGILRTLTPRQTGT